MALAGVRPTLRKVWSNAATSPSTAAPNIFTNCATETIPKKIVQIVLMKITGAAVHLVFRSLVFLIYLCYMDYFLYHNNQVKIKYSNRYAWANCLEP